MPDIINAITYYLMHLLSGFAMMAIFAKVYTWLTPIDEMALVNKGIIAAALSYGGAVVGFSLPIASSALHADSYPVFLLWGGISMAVQLVCYLILARLIPHLQAALEADNQAVGMLTGAVAIAAGLINAGCVA